MGYRFGMYFAKCASRAEAFEIACKFVDQFEDLERAKKHIRANSHNMPMSGRLTAEKRIQLSMWIHNNFKFNFVYWESQGLLGLFGDNYYGTTMFLKHIVFQDSTDQDLDLSTWEGIADDVVSICSEITADELLKSGKFNGYSISELENKLEFYSRTFAYELIFERLYLYDWLYEQPCNKFYRFSLNGIKTIEQKTSLMSFCKYL